MFGRAPVGTRLGSKVRRPVPNLILSPSSDFYAALLARGAREDQARGVHRQRVCQPSAAMVAGGSGEARVIHEEARAARCRAAQVVCGRASAFTRASRLAVLSRQGVVQLRQGKRAASRRHKGGRVVQSEAWHGRFCSAGDKTRENTEMIFKKSPKLAGRGPDSDFKNTNSDSSKMNYSRPQS